MINPRYTIFKVVFENCTNLKFTIWGEEEIYDLEEISKLELKILGAKVQDNHIRLECECTYERADSGYLTFNADHIKVFDQENIMFTIKT